jgi:membrane-associated protease RseP (regulator of RpoE activity)
MSPRARLRRGVRIDEVEEESPAEKAGFQKGDVVTEFDGERVRSARQFTRLVSETPPGRQVTAIVIEKRPALDAERHTARLVHGTASWTARIAALETLQDRVSRAADPSASTPPSSAESTAGTRAAGPRAVLLLGQHARGHHQQPVGAVAGVLRREGRPARELGDRRLRRRKGRREGRGRHRQPERAICRRSRSSCAARSSGSIQAKSSRSRSSATARR